MRSLQISGWVQRSLLLTNGAASTTHRITENLNWITSRKANRNTRQSTSTGLNMMEAWGRYHHLRWKISPASQPRQSSFVLFTPSRFSDLRDVSGIHMSSKMIARAITPDFQSQFKRHPKYEDSTLPTRNYYGNAKKLSTYVTARTSISFFLAALSTSNYSIIGGGQCIKEERICLTGLLLGFLFLPFFPVLSFVNFDSRILEHWIVLDSAQLAIAHMLDLPVSWTSIKDVLWLLNQKHVRSFASAFFPQKTHWLIHFIMIRALELKA